MRNTLVGERQQTALPVAVRAASDVRDPTFPSQYRPAHGQMQCVYGAGSVSCLRWQVTNVCVRFDYDRGILKKCGSS